MISFTKDELTALILRGLNIQDCATRFGTSRTYVSRKARKWGLSFRTSQAARVRLTRAHLLEAQRLSLSIEETAERYQVKRGYVSSKAHKEGIMLKGMQPTRTPVNYVRSSALLSRTSLPEFQTQESPPSLALLRLAKFDSIARRAVARKGGQLPTGKEPDPDGEG
jgi:hypothetical protein